MKIHPDALARNGVGRSHSASSPKRRDVTTCLRLVSHSPPRAMITEPKAHVIIARNDQYVTNRLGAKFCPA